MRSNRYLILASILLFTFTAKSLFAQHITWLNQAGDNYSNNSVGSVIVDHAHNVLVSGSIGTSAYFGSVSVATHGGYDAYIAKYDSSGGLIWVKNFGGINSDYGGMIAVDSSDNIYLAGDFIGNTMYFTATDSLTMFVAGSAYNAYLAKFDSDGNFIWAQDMGGSATSNTVKAGALAIGPDQCPVVGGTFYNDIHIQGTVMSHPYNSLFYAKFTPSGVLDWARMGQSLGICDVNNMSADRYGNIYSTGKISSPVTFGSITVPNHGGDDAYCCKYDSAGNFVYCKIFGSSMAVTSSGDNLDAGKAVKADDLGNVYLGGNFLVSYSSVALDEGFLMKLDDTGGQVWLKTFGDNSETVGSIDLDSAQNPVVSGAISTGDTIGGIYVPLVSNGYTFVGRFDKNTGNAFWIKTPTSAGSEWSSSLAVDQQSGAISLGGSFEVNVAWDTFTVTSVSSVLFHYNMYVVHMWDYSPTTTQVPLLPAAALRVYPNPAGDAVTIETSGATWQDISLADINGRIFDHWQSTSGAFTADIRSLPPGAYFITALDNLGNKSVQKLVKN